MKLSELLIKLGDYTKVIKGTTDVEITGLTSDSRKVGKGSVFVCIKGAVSDGHTYLAEVIEKGAAAVVIMDESDIYATADVTVIKTDDSRYCYALMSAAWFGNPAEKLFTIGITGTKGKTTTTYMIRNVLEKCGIKTGLIGTIETIIGQEAKASCNTTPESYQLQETFDKMVKAGCRAVVMEVSSQGLMLHRTAGINFDIGVFTNLEPDHIGPNEHSSFEQYMECKAMLFRQCKVGIVNGDDEHVDKILAKATCTVEKYGLKAGNDLQAVDINLYTEGGKIGTMYKVKGMDDLSIHLTMPGKFSVYNSLCAVAVTRHFNVAAEIVQEALINVSVKGRIEIIPVSDAFTLMIDYAHNAMALESLLKTLKEYKPKRLVCLFGCGGNRAKSRRYEMGEVSGRLADLTVITSDNPRNEEPQDIINDIITGISKTNGKYVEIIDRKEAIKYCIQNGQPGDIIVLAGKGHEDYQEIKGVKYPMDERVLIADILGELKEN